MHVSILEDIHEPDGAGLLCSGANSVAMMELIFSFALAQSDAGAFGGYSGSKEANMKPIRINADEALGHNSMLPEGIPAREVAAGA
jgi:hypothetical protein